MYKHEATEICMGTSYLLFQVVQFVLDISQHVGWHMLGHHAVKVIMVHQHVQYPLAIIPDDRTRQEVVISLKKSNWRGCHYLVSWEPSNRKLTAVGRILSVTSLMPLSTLPGPMRSTTGTRNWDVARLTALFLWLYNKDKCWFWGFPCSAHKFKCLYGR